MNGLHAFVPSCHYSQAFQSTSSFFTLTTPPSYTTLHLHHSLPFALSTCDHLHTSEPPNAFLCASSASIHNSIHSIHFSQAIYQCEQCHLTVIVSTLHLLYSSISVDRGERTTATIICKIPKRPLPCDLACPSAVAYSDNIPSPINTCRTTHRPPKCLSPKHAAFSFVAPSACPCSPEKRLRLTSQTACT
jgi:hypothetical protein